MYTSILLILNFLGGGGGVVGKYDLKENPKSDLDLDLGFVNFKTEIRKMVETETNSLANLTVASIYNVNQT